MKNKSLKDRLSRKFILLCSLVCLECVGCSKKDLSPPAVNPHPQDKIEMMLTLSGSNDVSGYRINVQREYGNMSKRCSNVHVFDGGWVEYPHGYVSSDENDNSILIYRDHYQPRSQCPWCLFGLAIVIYDKNGRRADGGLPADLLRSGYKVTLTCNFEDKQLGLCLPNRVVRSKSDVIINISIN